jgi:hypothetical protein
MSGSTTTDHSALLTDLGQIIAKHSDWLDGGTFQRIALAAADGYFPPSEVDAYVTVAAAEAALESALRCGEGLYLAHR